MLKAKAWFLSNLNSNKFFIISKFNYSLQVYKIACENSKQNLNIP